MIFEFHLPDVLICYSLCRNDFAAIDNGAAAHSQNEINTFFPCQCRALLYFFIGGIRHDPRKINHFFPCFLQIAANLVINAASLHGTSSISQHHGFPYLRKLSRQSLRRCLFSEIYFCRIRIYEIFHGRSSFVPLFPYFNTIMLSIDETNLCRKFPFVHQYKPISYSQLFLLSAYTSMPLK